MKSEGIYEKEPKYIPLYNPQKREDNEAGKVKVSIKIIPKTDAVSNPVGRAQEYPNRDPTLIRPKEGRGLSDFLKGSIFNINFSLGLFLRLIKYLTGVGGAIVTVLILFVNPGILVN